MTSVADSIGIRSHGIAGATLATLDLARARIFSLVRLGFPRLAMRPTSLPLARELDVGGLASLGRWLVEKGDPTKSGEFVVRLSLPATPERSPRRCITARSRASPRS